MTKSKILFANVLLALLCVALPMTGCAKEEPTKPSAEPTQAEPKTDKHDDMMTVSTRYGDLYFSDQWEDSVKVEQNSGERSEVLVFTGVIDGKEYPLFRVEIIDGADGSDAVGKITGEDGVERNVFVSMEPMPQGECPEQLYAMRDGVNDLIDNLK